jgi:hypothetical protein
VWYIVGGLATSLVTIRYRCVYGGFITNDRSRDWVRACSDSCNLSLPATSIWPSVPIYPDAIIRSPLLIGIDPRYDRA